MSALTLIRAKEEDSGNYTMRVENGDQRRSVGLILEVKGQRGEWLEPFITFTSLNTALTSFRAQVSVSLFLKYLHTLCCAYLLLPGLHYSACSHCGPNGHPPWLSHRPVCGVHYSRAAFSCGGVVRLQEHQTVSSDLCGTTCAC